MTQLVGIATAFRAWSPEEDATLRATYLTGGPELAATKLSRSRSSVLHRASRLRLLRKRRWTPEDDRLLTALWGESTLGAIARRLGRTQLTVYYRAHQIGLQRGAPPGTEYVRQAAERTGYLHIQLLAILRWASVKPKRSMSKPSKGASYRFHVVDPFDVDQAIAAWLATEAVEAAARARGIIGPTLRAWLRAAKAAGFPIPDEPPGQTSRKHWRVSSKLIDEVVAWRGRFESVSAAARRYGLTRQTLCLWLTQAGAPRTQVKPWFVDREVVDRVVSERKTVRAKPRIGGAS